MSSRLQVSYTTALANAETKIVLDQMAQFELMERSVAFDRLLVGLDTL